MSTAALGRDAAGAIVAAAAAALNVSPDVSGCPDTVAGDVVPVVLRAAADALGLVCRQDADALVRWADEIEGAQGAAPGGRRGAG